MRKQAGETRGVLLSQERRVNEANRIQVMVLTSARLWDHLAALWGTS
jgi:hypothetical protein